MTRLPWRGESKRTVVIHRKKSRGKTGFTLIELLVVIAVIAILAALLLPALARSKDQARSVVCKNHLHEMGMALRMYADDTKVYPYGQINVIDSIWPEYWYIALQPYYSLNWTNPAYHCPAYNGSIGPALDADVFFGNYGSYSYNVFGAAEFGSNWDPFALGINWGG
jgi:prepilin-type N-terminal cleavage/methylation domain-containing protein